MPLGKERLPFDEMNDIDERYTYIYGGSVWSVDWDNSSEYMGEIGGVRIECMSPKDFIPQPSIYDLSDMEYCFLKFVTTKSELTRRYGIPEEKTVFADFEYEYGGSVDASDTVKIVTCFYRDEDGEVGRFIFSGEVILSDLERYYMRKGEVCKRCGKERGRCRCNEPLFEDGDLTFESIRLKKDPRNLANAENLDTGKEFLLKIPYYVPRVFPIVIRKNTSSERALFGQSDCEYIRPSSRQ